MSGGTVIKSATYGDENSSADVTRAITSLFRKNNNFIEIKASPSLLNMQGAGAKITLTNSDETDIRNQAEEACGNALDRECIDSQTETLRKRRLQEKASEEVFPRIKGERLTVTVVEGGKTKTLVVPRDEMFQYGRRAKEDVPVDEYLAPFASIFTMELAWKAIGSAIYYFVWAFGSALTWIALSQSYQLPTGHMIRPGDYWWLKYVGTIIAILTAGYGGFLVVIITYFVLGLKHYIGQRSLLASTQ
jgi:hypothetical protein